MGKKQQPKQGHGEPSAPTLPQKELYHRVNFAIQASAFLQSLAGPSSSSDRKGKRKVASLDDEISDNGPDIRKSLAMGTMRATKKMAAHTQLKLDPSLKRNICQGCDTVLVPGLTSRIRNRPNKRTISITHSTCLECSQTLSIPAPPVDPGDPALDGSNRRRRREKVAKKSKTAFYNREKGEAQAGHTVWADDRKLEAWGERSSAVTSKERESGNTNEAS